MCHAAIAEARSPMALIAIPALTEKANIQQTIVLGLLDIQLAHNTRRAE
jgi:hypothetical protein